MTIQTPTISPAPEKNSTFSLSSSERSLSKIVFFAIANSVYVFIKFRIRQSLPPQIRIAHSVQSSVPRLVLPNNITGVNRNDDCDHCIKNDHLFGRQSFARRIKQRGRLFGHEQRSKNNYNNDCFERAIDYLKNKFVQCLETGEC